MKAQQQKSFHFVTNDSVRKQTKLSDLQLTIADRRHCPRIGTISTLCKEFVPHRLGSVHQQWRQREFKVGGVRSAEVDSVLGGDVPLRNGNTPTWKGVWEGTFFVLWSQNGV